MYRLGRRSLAQLEGVDDRVVAVVERAIVITAQDFSVFEGLRTTAKQAQYVAQGRSKTMNSKHLLGKAVDLVPYANGKLVWEWDLIYPIATAVRRAGKDLNVAIRWGGAWDTVLTHTSDSPKRIVKAYQKRRTAKNRKVFVDGPHYELK